MGRKKIQIKQIPESRNKSVTFLKRKAGLIKKAWELSVLCSADVAVIIFGENGKAFEFSSANMDDILIRYTEFPGTIEKKPASELAAAAAKDAGEDPPTASDEDESGSEAQGPKSKTAKGKQIASNLAAKRAGLPVGEPKPMSPQLVPNLPSVNLLNNNAAASSSRNGQGSGRRSGSNAASGSSSAQSQQPQPTTQPPISHFQPSAQNGGSGMGGLGYYQTARWQQAQQQGAQQAPLPGAYAQSLGPGATGGWDQQGRVGDAAAIAQANGLRLDIPSNNFGAATSPGGGFGFSSMFPSALQPSTLGFGSGGPAAGMTYNGLNNGGGDLNGLGSNNSLSFLLQDRGLFNGGNSLPLGVNSFPGGSDMLSLLNLFQPQNGFNQQQQQQPQQPQQPPQQQHSMYNHPLFASFANHGQQPQGMAEGSPQPPQNLPQRSASMPNGFAWPSSHQQQPSHLGGPSADSLPTFDNGPPLGDAGGLTVGEDVDGSSASEDEDVGGAAGQDFGLHVAGVGLETSRKRSSPSLSMSPSSEADLKRPRLEV